MAPHQCPPTQGGASALRPAHDATAPPLHGATALVPGPILACRLVLANGEQEVFECFSLVEGGEPNRRPLVCSFVLPPGEGSAAYEAMRLQGVVELDEATPNK